MKKNFLNFLTPSTVGAMLLMCLGVGCDMLDIDEVENRVKTIEFYECEDSLVVDVFTIDGASAGANGYYALRGLSVLRCKVRPISAAANLNSENFLVLTSVDTTRQNELDRNINVNSPTKIDTATVCSIQDEGNGVFKLVVQYKYEKVAKYASMKNCITASSISIGVKNKYTDNVHTSYRQNKLNSHENLLNWLLYDGTQAINPKGNFSTVHDRIYSIPWTTAPADSKTVLLKDYDFYFTFQDVEKYSDSCIVIEGTPYITMQKNFNLLSLEFAGVHKDKYDTSTKKYDVLKKAGDTNGSLQLEHYASFKSTENGWYDIDEALPQAWITTAYSAYQDHTVYVVEEYALKCGSVYFPMNKTIKVKAAYKVSN